MSHTPKPWRIGDAGRTVFGPKSDQPAPVTVASLPGATPRVTREERHANGHLIAGAPDLLEAAELARAAIINTPVLDDSEEWTVIAEALGEAIAKVKGGEDV